jgi:glyoxylase-like metal-dependent hydrolase (beta-lactamase superfamily II)/rhodanese-related sulfurtransferase
VASRATQEAAVIDPGVDIAPYLTILHDRKFALNYVIDTHIHADHISGARRLAEETGAELCLYESARVSYPFHRLTDQEELALGQLRLRVLHTPGHRPELISILLFNLDRGREPEAVLTGDSLLVGDVGRPDFNGGDPAVQFESIEQLLALPDWVAVFPGHFEGLCGKSMEGRPVTTIGFERHCNSLAQLPRDEFIATLSANIPERPLNMLAIEATNRGEYDAPWAMVRESLAISEIPVVDLPPLDDSSILLDVREPDEYTHGHLPGAQSLPQAELASRLAELPRDHTVYVVCWSGSRSQQAARFLRQQGYDNVINLTGGTQTWIRMGKPLQLVP